MKKIVLLLALATCALAAQAQRFAYIDSEYILKAVPEYRAAQKQIDVLAQQWQKEIDDRNADAAGLYKKLQAEQVLLTDDMKGQREKEIKAKEDEARNLSKKRFGYQGDLFQKRKELVKPIQDKLYDAVNKLAKDRSLDFVFDKASDLVMLYSNAKYDRSDEVIELMGYVVPEPTQAAPTTPVNNTGNGGTGGTNGNRGAGAAPNGQYNPTGNTPAFPSGTGGNGMPSGGNNGYPTTPPAPIITHTSPSSPPPAH